MAGYPQTLIYFMWPWQVHYMISCKVRAESLFGEIDTRLMPTAFLLGFKIDENTEQAPICYEPEKMDFLADDFLSIETVAEEFAAKDPRRNMFYSGPGMQEQMDTKRRHRNFGEAIKDILDKSDKFTDKIHFVSQGLTRNGYNIYIVLQLNKAVYSSYVFLNYVDPEEILHRDLSLIDAAIRGYLEDCRYRLYLPDARTDHGPERSSVEILRAAAENFLLSVAYVGRSHGIHTMPSACEHLCLSQYEGKPNTGHLIICRKDHPALELTLELDTPFPIQEYRKLRKIMELSNDSIGVITNSESILGLGRIKKEYNSQNEDVFHVFFRGTHCYDVMHQTQPILFMRYGKPVQQGQIIIFEKFSTDARRIFTGITDTQIEQLYSLACAAAEGNRGCMLVFLNDAEQEAKRLAKQSISIKPRKLDKESIATVTSIDGAVIIDIDGYIHAKGVILDGIVGIEGDSSRGSRYNSALTYCEYWSSQKKIMIVVVSEDGMVDIIPDLMPQIRHSEIIQFINTLESINSTETFNSQTFYNVMDILKKRSFYLTETECNQINALNKALSELDEKSGKMMWRKFDDFIPNPRMNESYYISE